MAIILTSDQLTLDQAAFAAQHGIPIDRIFDARDMRRWRYGPAMEKAGALLAINVSQCKRGGHTTMRDHNGKCIQCNPHSLGFAKSYRTAGTVSFAVTATKPTLVKIGTCGDFVDREKTLNKPGSAYAGVTDWKMIRNPTKPNCGEIERRIHSRLAPYACAGILYKDQ
jgi:hypothetical protein